MFEFNIPSKMGGSKHKRNSQPNTEDNKKIKYRYICMAIFCYISRVFVLNICLYSAGFLTAGLAKTERSSLT